MNFYNNIINAINERLSKSLNTFTIDDEDNEPITYQRNDIHTNTDVLSASLNALIDKYKHQMVQSNFIPILKWLEEYGNKVPDKSVHYYKVLSLSALRDMIEVVCKYKPDSDLNFLDISELDDISELFMQEKKKNVISKWDKQPEQKKCHLFNGDISKWDVSNIKKMRGLFAGSSFQGDISNWDVSQVEDMSYMFMNNECFKSDISKWDISELSLMDGMFKNCSVFIDINNWDVSNVRSMKELYMDWKTQIPEKYELYDFKAKQMTYTYMSNWQVEQVINMESMFKNAYLFNSDLSKWNPRKCKDMESMFENACEFNCNINNWDVHNVTTMQRMFYQTGAFNSPLNKWNTENVLEMSEMFKFAHAFKQDISMWDTESVANNYEMFQESFPEEYKPSFDARRMKAITKYLNK